MILDMGRKGKQVSPATFVNMATKFQITYEQGIFFTTGKMRAFSRNETHYGTRTHPLKVADSAPFFLRDCS